MIITTKIPESGIGKMIYDLMYSFRDEFVERGVGFGFMHYISQDGEFISLSVPVIYNIKGFLGKWMREAIKIRPEIREYVVKTPEDIREKMEEEYNKSYPKILPS